MEFTALLNSVLVQLRSCALSKTSRVVKLTTILILTACLQISAKTYSQRITISKKNASLSEIFIIIYQQSGYFFLLKDDLIKDARNVTIDVKDASIEEVLKICFADQPFSYSIADHTIIVTRKYPAGILKEGPPLIGGRVLNDKGEPLEGAYISIKGSNTGTQTDSKGNFTLKDKRDSLEIIISYTGYQSRMVLVHKAETANIVLFPSLSLLDQVQVIAYGTTSKRLNTGDVSTVTSETIQSQPVSNPLAALEGRVSGLVVTQQTGVAGGNFNVQIRGRNSIFSGNNPLYIIDGVPFSGTAINSSIVGAGIIGAGSAFSNIDPSNIESIDILKDADATAIYGSRGANGVILITTKKGKVGKTAFDFNLNTGVGSVTRLMPILNTADYLTMRHEAFLNDGTLPDPSYDHDLTIWDTTSYTNWQKELIGSNAHITNLQATLSGGNINTQYTLGGSFYSSSTVYPGDFADRKISTHFSLSQTSIDRRFKLNFTADYLIDNNDLPSVDLTGFANRLPPDAPAPLTASGQINWQNGTYGDNPYQLLLQPYRSNANNLIASATTSYSIINGLDIRANLGYNRMQIDELSEIPVSTINPAYGQTTGYSYFSNQAVSSWIVEPQLQYETKNRLGNFSFLIGLTFQQNLNKGQNLYATGFTNDAMLGNIAAAANVIVADATDINYRYQSGFARINYNWDDKYILNFTARRDGSSRFGPGNQFANFGAIGAAWLFSNEKWWKGSLPFISFGKLRGSYGLTGNDQIGDYKYLDSWTPIPFTYQGLAGVQPSFLANANYGWENNRKTEVGLEIGVSKDRILFSLSYFINKSSNQLINFTLPGITGFTSIIQNSIATVENSGFEFDLNTTNVKSNNFLWQSAINFTIPRNTLLNYPDLSESPYGNIYQIGKSLSVSKSFHYTGIDAQTGLYSFGSKDPLVPVYPDDIQALKKTGPVFYGGFQNTFKYKNWQLGIFFQFVNQQGFNYLYYNFSQPGMYGNQPKLVMNRWRKPGDVSEVEKFSQSFGDPYTSYLNVTTSSDQVISNASYLRLKTLDISYSFSGKWMTNLKIKGLCIYVQGQNLITITDFKGNDPENQSFYALPPLKILTAGVKCSL
jgi:TonB-linked SusC/RagA family outer membrane protein